MNLERIVIDVTDVDARALGRIADEFAEIAASGEQATPANLFFADLAAALREVTNAREVQLWQFEETLQYPPDPNEPTRYWYPPGWRGPDEEAVGL
jgi:hypothetical protein